MQLSKVAILAALASLSLTGACKSDDAGASNTPAQPGEATSPVPPSANGERAAPSLPAPQRGGFATLSPEERRARMQEQYDTDRDGQLSREERKAMRAAVLERRMTRLDGDHDGRISRQEAEAAPFGRRLLADFDSADTNKDSFVSREELDTAMKALRQQRREMRLQGSADGEPAAPAPIVK